MCKTIHDMMKKGTFVNKLICISLFHIRCQIKIVIKKSKQLENLLFYFLHFFHWGITDRAETVDACVKICNLEPPKLCATAPKIWQHLIFCSLGLKLLIYHFKKLIIKTLPYLRLVDDLILHSFCPVRITRMLT